MRAWTSAKLSILTRVLDLSGLEPGVAAELRDVPDVGTAFERRCRCRVTEEVTEAGLPVDGPSSRRRCSSRRSAGLSSANSSSPHDRPSRR